jgi:hypothetical protein
LSRNCFLKDVIEGKIEGRKEGRKDRSGGNTRRKS